MKPFWEGTNNLLACIWNILFIIKAFQQDNWSSILLNLVGVPLLTFLFLLDFRKDRSSTTSEICAFIVINALSASYFFRESLIDLGFF